jgi:hypothetical protein
VQHAEGLPLFVRRAIGQGEVVFCSTGLVSSWNTLSSSHAMLVYDRLVRGMLAATIPQRNHEPREQLSLPIGPATNLSLALWRPEAALGEPLDVGFLGQAQRGVVLPHLWQAGLYRVVAERREATSPAESRAAAEPTWTIPLAVNAPAAESDPTPLTPGRFAEITAGTSWSWLTEDDEISLAGATIQGQNLWWYLVAAVLLLLLGEMLLLAWPVAAAAPRSMSPGPLSRPLPA